MPLVNILSATAKSGPRGAALGGRMIKPRPQDADDKLACSERLGGLLKNYYRGRRGHEGFLLYRQRSFPTQDFT
ncbi:MAG: hypothetical protein K5787_20725 [Lentisphaeria bacterium]|nr:hypothetical protein [Lentisphaeria bacterium]